MFVVPMKFLPMDKCGINPRFQTRPAVYEDKEGIFKLTYYLGTDDPKDDYQIVVFTTLGLRHKRVFRKDVEKTNVFYKMENISFGRRSSPSSVSAKIREKFQSFNLIFCPLWTRKTRRRIHLCQHSRL
eukprot:GHVP01045717.1.p1 GENE.GHVP01045717.1~~GHVP01045717.1.p1  ORF type:complete len:128 (+),score=14.41 GHVP01045717.1:598-981(+)